MTTRDKWIEAGKMLAKDPLMRVLCPDCNAKYLTVEDIRYNSSELERQMQCSNCGGHNVLRLRRPVGGDQYWKVS